MNSNATATLVSRVKSGVDAYGDDVYTETETPDVSVVFAPGGSTETVQGGDTVVTQPTVYMPTGVDVTALDAVVVDGYGRFEIDGDPAVWPANPFTGWQPDMPVVVKLKAVAG